MDNLNEKINKAVNEVFEYASWDMLHLVDNIIGRIDWDNFDDDASNDLYDELAQAIDDSLIYYDDQWTVAKHYANGPADLDWQSALYQLIDDLHDVIARVL